MKKRLIAITLMMSMLLALFVLAPGTVSADIEPPGTDTTKSDVAKSDAVKSDATKSDAKESVVTSDSIASVDVAPMSTGTIIPGLILVSSELRNQRGAIVSNPGTGAVNLELTFANTNRNII